MSIEKDKDTKELAKEIVNAWNQPLENESDEEFKERMTEKEIKEIIRKIESKKETFEKIALLKELDDEVSKFRKELINKFQRENK